MARAGSWKNRLILRLVKLLQTAKKAPETPERILILSTTALGDTLWATPALAALRQSFPKAHIAVLTSPVGKELLSHNPSVDQILLLKEPMLPRFFSLRSTLKRERFDTALIFHTSQRLALPLCALSSIPRILGTTGINKKLDPLLTDPILPCYEHEIERRLGIVEKLGAKRGAETLSYYIQPEEQIQLDGKPLVAFHPGSKEPFRRWPPAHFATVGRALMERFGCRIYLTGTPSERPILDEIQHLLPEAEIAEGLSTVRKLAAFLDNMDLFLSNDTGPFHLACALNRPTVGIYVSTDPGLCGPHLAPNAAILARAPTCSPCLKRRCREPFCFLQIGTEEAIDLCSKILAEHCKSSGK
jgi:ADP-heptose:LPS heptosyltransferase